MSNITTQGPFAIPGFSGTWEQAIRIAWASDYTGISSAALLGFDCFITLEQEIRLVWFGRWGVPAALYMINRYGTMIQAFLNIVTDLDYELSMPACLSWNLFYNWSIPVFMAVIEATLTLRVVALWENDRRLWIPLWTWYIINVAAMMVMMGLTNQGTYPTPSPDPPTLGCTIAGAESYFWAIYVPSLVYETTVAGLTLYKAIEHKRLLAKVPLLYVLIRDGFFYFFIVFALMLINTVVDLTVNFLYFDWAPQLSVAIASAVSCRLFLNLRETAHPTHPTTVYNSSRPFEMSPMTAPTISTWSIKDSQRSRGINSSTVERGDMAHGDQEKTEESVSSSSAGARRGTSAAS